MVQTVDDAMYYDENAKRLIDEFYRNLTREQKKLSFERIVFDPVFDGHPSRISRFFQFIVNSCFCLLVIFLSFFTKHLEHDFRYFFGNLAIVDLCFAIAGLLFHWLQPILSRLFDIPENIYVQTIVVKLPLALTISMIFAIALTSFHRHVIICKQNEAFFTKRRIFVLCLLSYSPILWPLVVLSIRAFVRRLTANASGVFTFALPYELLVLTLIGTLIFVFHFYFMLNLVFYLCKNQARLAETLNKSVEEIRKEKRLILAILIQGTVPYLCLSPALYSLLARHILAQKAMLPLDTIYLPILGYSVQQFFILFLYMNPFFDSLTTLLVVKQYFKALRLSLGFKEEATAIQPVRNLNPPAQNTTNRRTGATTAVKTRRVI